MDAIRLTPPRRLSLPISNRWGAGEMSVLDFGDPDRPVDLIFVHANGFNAMTCRSLLAPLSGSLRIWAPDLRGHGRTTLPADPAGRRGWTDHRDDLISLLEQVEGPPVVLSGHSMGGTSSLLAAAERPERVSRLVLLDPVIWTRLAVLAFQLPLLDRMAERIPLVKNARKRRATFDSREQALAAYKGRGAFKGWPEIALSDYLIDGLVEAPDGGFRLTCDPQWEASNYAAQSHDPWRALRRVGRPVHILKAGIGSTCSLTPASRMTGVRVEVVTDGTHFFPMLKPDIARDALLEAAV